MASQDNNGNLRENKNEGEGEKEKGGSEGDK